MPKHERKFNAAATKHSKSKKKKKIETVDSKIKNFSILKIEKKRFNWCKTKNAKNNN